MSKDRKICVEPTCYNYKRYCRRPGHTVELITPMKAIAKTGDKLKEDLKVYRKEARRYLTQHPQCGICKQPSSTIHHRQGRIGELLLDKSKWLSLCLPCHQRVTEDSAWAIKNGYSESRLTH
jgi:hypothetical protein